MANDGNLIHLTAKYDKTIESFCCKISSSVKNSLNVDFGDHIILRANSREIALRVNQVYDDDDTINNDDQIDQELIYIGDESLLHLGIKQNELGSVAISAANIINAEKVTFAVLERDLNKIPKQLTNNKAIAELYFSLILTKEPKRNQVVTKGCLIDLYAATNPPEEIKQIQKEKKALKLKEKEKKKKKKKKKKKCSQQQMKTIIKKMKI